MSVSAFVNEGTIRKEIFVDGQYFDHHCMGLEVSSWALDTPG